MSLGSHLRNSVYTIIILGLLTACGVGQAQTDTYKVLATMRQGCPGIITVVEGPYKGLEFVFDQEDGKYKRHDPSRDGSECRDLRSEESFVNANLFVLD